MVHSIDKASKGIWKCYIGSIPILGVSVVQAHMSDLQQTRLATEKQNCDCLFVALNCSQMLSTSGVLLSFTGGK